MRIRTTIASAALLSFGAGAASAASVTKSIEVDAPPAKVWAMIGPFCSISAWHPAIGKCTTDGNAEPTRTLVTIDGKATFVEIETARDEKGMSYSYAIKSSPLQLSDYKSTIKVEPKGEGLSTITRRYLYTGRRQGGQCRGGRRGNLSVWPRFGEGQGRDVNPSIGVKLRKEKTMERREFLAALGTAAAVSSASQVFAQTGGGSLQRSMSLSTSRSKPSPEKKRRSPSFCARARHWPRPNLRRLLGSRSSRTLNLRHFRRFSR